MTCNQLPAEDLVAWLDGELSALDASRVASHVAACGDCRGEAAALRESGALFLRLPALQPSAGFAARVIAAAQSGATPGSSSTSPSARGRVVVLRPRVAAAAAAVLVGISAGAWWLSSPGEKTAGEVLTAREEEALAQDLAVISNLDALQRADAKELAQLVEDLDVIEGLNGEGEGG